MMERSAFMHDAQNAGDAVRHNGQSDDGVGGLSLAEVEKSEKSNEEDGVEFGVDMAPLTHSWVAYNTPAECRP